MKRTHVNQKEEEEGQEEESGRLEVMDTADENCSLITVANGGESDVELLQSLLI